MPDAAQPSKKSNPSEKNILVIDDDDAILALLKTTFEVEGFNVKTARSGRDIAKVAAQFQPDLVITDLMMPGVGGYDVLRALQGDPSMRKVPVLVITGSHMNDSTKSMMKQEFNLAGYFEKPLRPERLMKSVHQLLNTMSQAEIRAQQQEKNEPGAGFGGPFGERF